MSLRITNFSVGQKANVKIDSLSFNGGRGVGRVEGMVIFVPWTVPGDHVQIEITEVKKSFCLGKLEKILEFSRKRRVAPCPVFGKCGGCTWQNVVYEEQLVQKQKILEASLREVRKLQELIFEPCLASPTEFHYRNRIQLHKQNGKVGYFARGSREIVAITACPIGEEKVSEKIPSLAQEQDGRFEISRSSSGEIRVEAGKRSAEEALFSQVNSGQNERMIENLLNWSASLKFVEIWDLYCGSGNLTIPLKNKFSAAAVTGVELSQEAIRQAEQASSQITWVSENVSRFLKRQHNASGVLMVLDPPRDGLDKPALQELLRVLPDQVIYISCNPMTFARDAREMLKGYSLQKIQGIDMFPQTEHVEVMALFERRANP
jgi:23S rRNA (uracil1939-C5)-methyltransferase